MLWKGTVSVYFRANCPRNLVLPNRQHRYELQNSPDFAVQVVKSVYKCLESLSYLGPKIWELLLLELKETDFVNPQNCPCFSKIYLQKIGFI